MRDVEAEDTEDKYSAMKLNGNPITELRYANDTALLSKTTEGLNELMQNVKKFSQNKNLLLNAKKTKNPILYCIMHKGFKRFLFNIIKCRWRKIRWRKQNTVSIMGSVIYGDSLTNSQSYNASSRSPSYKMVARRTANVQKSEIILCKDLSGARSARCDRASVRGNNV
ncbi:hypothetical protein ElyMa_006647700 [Elysia marginata]|uniref:Reverse transcriptase domain-containing protein n=1 Tax=Elysia marginata TaxID=1093978 RepID=A0AAV4IEK9_9GAST|nr:hypothetical protein ElyMa_006647700 [Elysia marginata]